MTNLYSTIDVCTIIQHLHYFVQQAVDPPPNPILAPPQLQNWISLVFFIVDLVQSLKYKYIYLDIHHIYRNVFKYHLFC